MEGNAVSVHCTPRTARWKSYAMSLCTSAKSIITGRYLSLDLSSLSGNTRPDDLLNIIWKLGIP
ncbi:hypothetical protein F2Q70_00014482 [Brassica cretica]|uniref:Uncharacterized protein n=1 Tax=Brassica cretica TaxID=69181 RepID=A0A8S9I4B8_BRACR|nr:hypothetical protein F2Q70_00014482 [Brassica cretica]